MTAKTVAVTGAGGYIGSGLVSRFRAAGWSVLRLSRSGSADDPDTVEFQLGEVVEAEVFQSRLVNALVHCAYDFGPRRREDIRRVNVDGSRLLLAAARAGGVERVAVLSTISAFQGCRSEYGLAKLEIEAAAAEAGALVVRPGLVFGDARLDAGGMLGSLARSAQGGLVPLLDGGAHPQYLVHEEDLFQLLLRYCAGSVANPGRPIVAASARQWPLRDLMAELARRQGTQPRFLSVPWWPVWLGLWLAELAHLPVPFRSDSVVSLVYQDGAPDFESLAAAGITAREFGRG